MLDLKKTVVAYIFFQTTSGISFTSYSWEVGLFDLGRKMGEGGGHLSQGDHLKLKLYFSPSLTFSLFPSLIVSDTGLTKFLISGLPQPHCSLLLCLASVGEQLPLLIMSHIMSANCHSKNLHFSLFCSFTGHMFYSQSSIWSFIGAQMALISLQVHQLLYFHRNILEAFEINYINGQFTPQWVINQKPLGTIVHTHPIDT